MHSSRSGWQGLKAVIDTGTEENWISQAIVERLGLDVKKGLPVKFVTFDGRKLSSGTIVEGRSARVADS